MIKIQDLINITTLELSDTANKAMIYVLDELKAEDSVSEDKVREVINKVVIEYSFEYIINAYDYLYNHVEEDLSEAIDAGNKTAVGMARYYLVKELFNKLEEMKGGN